MTQQPKPICSECGRRFKKYEMSSHEVRYLINKYIADFGDISLFLNQISPFKVQNIVKGMRKKGMTNRYTWKRGK